MLESFWCFCTTKFNDWTLLTSIFRDQRFEIKFYIIFGFSDFCTHSCQPLEVAELITVCWLQIDGKYNANNLIKGVKYGVYLAVELSDNLCMNGPVTLKLTRPNGTTEEHKEDLKTKPKNTLVGLKVGEFCNTGACGCENTVKFSMNGCDGTTWKTGLTVVGAVIAPVNC